MTATRRSAERHARRMLGRSYLTPDPLTAAFNRAGRLARFGARHHRTVERIGRFRWVWRITDDSVSPHVVVASGRAWTKARGWARLERAYARLLNAADRRAES